MTSFGGGVLVGWLDAEFLEADTPGLWVDYDTGSWFTLRVVLPIEFVYLPSAECSRILIFANRGFDKTALPFLFPPTGIYYPHYFAFFLPKFLFPFDPPSSKEV